MPATSEKQRRLFYAAKHLQESGKTGGDTPAARIARTVGKKKIREFTTTNRLAKLIK